MPVRPLNLDTGIVGLQTIVEDGARINGITIWKVPTGVEYFFKLGNNARLGPLDDIITIDFGPDIDIADVTEGLQIGVDVAVPAGRIVGMISYTASNRGESRQERGVEGLQ